MKRLHKHPEYYHQTSNKNNYFEGWYFKQVTKDLKHTIAFIPGVSFNKGKMHTFIQCLYEDENKVLKAFYFNYDRSFTSYEKPFSVEIEDNFFSLSKLKVHMKSDEGLIKGVLEFGPLTPIKTSLMTPNIMGFFSYLPFMECKHGVLSMSHSIQGRIEINGKIVDFSDGIGYIEKDWGYSFPKAYTWMQSNHFENESVSFFCATADIPVGKLNFKGLIANLCIGNDEYRFATYNGTKLIMSSFTEQDVIMELRHSKYKLFIKGSCEKSHRLIAPKMGKMNQSIKEGLSGVISLRLIDKNDNIILETRSIKSGMELVPTNND